MRTKMLTRHHFSDPFAAASRDGIIPAFWIYTTIIVITVAPVTETDGQVFCATPSRGFPYINTEAQEGSGPIDPTITLETAFVYTPTP